VALSVTLVAMAARALRWSSEVARLAHDPVPDPFLAYALSPLTSGDLSRGLAALGFTRGKPAFVHASLRALGWIAGGVDALIETLTEHGTIVAQVGWEDNRWHMYAGRLPEEWRLAYRDETPAFDPLVSQSAAYEGRLAERLRTWPGARRSAHPHVGVAAVGPDAEWLTAEHPLGEGFGRRSPYARLAEAEGQVLLLGAPLTAISILHHAEAVAAVPDKRRFSYRVPIVVGGRRRWARVDDLDLHAGALPYDRVRGLGGAHPFERIARDSLAAGIGRRGSIGRAPCHLFPAAGLVEFAVRWLERELGSPPVGAPHSNR
jgi:aminoglycoside 3-N-acetyltransferase